MFFIIFVIIFEVNLVAEQKQAQLVTIFFYISISLNSFISPLPYLCSSVLELFANLCF